MTTTTSLLSHRAITLLTQGYSNPQFAKTAMSMLRYRTQDVLAVLDQDATAETAQELLQQGGAVPVKKSLADIERSDALYLGIAPPGGKLPMEWKPIILEAISRKMDIVSGLHEFLRSDHDYVHAAKEAGVELIDVRDVDYESTAKGTASEQSSVRIHTVGHDCSVGKMVASLEVHLGLEQAGRQSSFIATGQTGIMVSGQGMSIDRAIIDFANGAAENLVTQNSENDFLVIEGQGSISHPAYSAVTLSLLHGCAPQGLIYCYEAGRAAVKGLTHIPLPEIALQMDLYLSAARLRFPCEFVGVAVNTRFLDEADAAEEVRRIESETGLPACDVYRDGSQKLVDACLQLERKLKQK